jgi:hypothetical protein
LTQCQHFRTPWRTQAKLPVLLAQWQQNEMACRLQELRQTQPPQFEALNLLENDHSLFLLYLTYYL